MAVVKFSKQTIEPNPLEVDYWVDITSDPYGSVWKYYNGIDWVSLNLNDGSDDGLSSFDYYTKEQVNSLLSGKADVDSVESKVDDAEFANVIQNIEFREIGDNQMEMVLLKYDNATVGVTIPMASETNPGMLSGESFRDFVKQSQLQSLYDELYQIMSDLSLAEKERNDAELLRKTNEDARISAETNRFNAENTRQFEEANRVTNESNRITAENNRTTAEGNRESTFNTLKGQMQIIIQEGQTAVAATEKATSDAQNVVNEYDTKIAKQDSKLSELGSEVDDFKKTITNQVNNYEPIEIHGDVTNAADEEDLTSDENNLLKLKDRNNLNGMGYVILRKNKTFAEQLTQTNTIYEIRYDFDLNGEEVTIPEGCILKFEGGSLNNGIANYNSCRFLGSPKNINIEIKGDIASNNINIEWFGCVGDGVTDNTVALSNIIKAFQGKVIVIPKGIFLITEQISIYKEFNLQGEGVSSVIYSTYDGFAFKYVRDSSTSNQYLRLYLSNFYFRGTYPSIYSSDKPKTNTSFLQTDKGTYITEAIIKGLKVSNVKTGFELRQAYWTRIDSCIFSDYNDACVLSAANSSSITNNFFRGGYNTGLSFIPTFDLDDNDPEREFASIGVNITGNDFSLNNYAGLFILGRINSSTITGNYFESEPGYQILVGDSSHSRDSELRSSFIDGNAGLWAGEKKGIKVYGAFNFNRCFASVYMLEGSSGIRNTGDNEVSSSVSAYNEVFVYGQKYINGIKEHITRQIKDDYIPNVCIPANSKVVINSFAGRRVGVLYYKSLTSGVKLTVRTVEATPIYIVGNENEGISSMEDEKSFNESYTDLGVLKNIFVEVHNSTDTNIVTDIQIKYFFNLYGK